MANRQRWLWIASGGLVVVLVGTLLVLFFRPTGAPDRIRELEAEGAPVRIEDLAADPEDDNLPDAGVPLQRLEGDLEKLSVQLAPVFGGPYLNNVLSDAEAKTVMDALDKHPDFWKELTAAVGRPYHPVTKDDAADATALQAGSMQRLQRNKSISRIVKAKALAEHQRGESVEALRTCLVGLQFARLLDAEPMMMAALTGGMLETVMVETLAAVLPPANVSEELRGTLNDLEAELEQHDPAAHMRRALASERVFGLDRIATFGGPLGRLNPATSEAPEKYLALIDQETKLLAGPLEEIATAPAPTKTGSPLIDPLIPVFQRGREATLNRTAHLNAARILIAAAKVPAEQLPNSINELASGYDDPFDSKPMKSRIDSRGLTVYAVGPDGIDQDGNVAAGPDVGLTAPQLGADDKP